MKSYIIWYNSVMDVIENIFQNIWVQRGIWAAVVILFSILMYRIIAGILTRKEKRTPKIMSSKKNKTIIRMLKSVVAGTLGIITVLMVLQIYGVDVTSMLAGVGIVGIVVGFALQDSLKDIIRGFVIVSDNYYEIGDVVQFGENLGQVTSVSLLTTKIQDINTGNTVSVSNRNISQIEVVSGDIYLSIPIPYEVPVEKAEEILASTISSIKKIDNVTDASLLGLNKITDSALEYTFMINCPPNLKLPTRRRALRLILDTLRAHKISLPYPHLEVKQNK